MRERQLVRLMAQVLEQGWLNVDNPKFSAGEMSEAVASATGRKPDVLQVGALLSRMGVPATSRYRRSMPALLDRLPTWVADAGQSDDGHVKSLP